MENTELWNRARKLNLGKDFLNGLDELLTSLESDNKQLIITDVVNQRELLLKQQSDWLMTQTKLPVEQIVEFTEHFKQ